jgi:gliding motility-associated-like protein
MPTFSAAGTYSCAINNTVTMCNTSVQVVVSSNMVAPTITITPLTQTLTCTTLTGTISTTVNPSSGVSYTWTGTGVTGLNTSSVIVNQAGTYSVVILDAANGCTNTANSSVVSNVTSPTITVTPPVTTTLTCAVTTITLNATSTTTNAPVWSTPSGAAANPVSATVLGDYVVSVTDAASGCSTSQTITISSNVVPPTANAGTTTPIPCGASTTSLNGIATPSTGVIYSWTGPTITSIVSGSNTANPIVGETGVYTLTVVGTNGCQSTSTVSVTQGSVNAQFTANPTTGLAPLAVDFTNQSIGAISYNWDFGNGVTSTNTNPSNTYTANGTFTVMMVASSGTCLDTAYAIIIVENGLTLEIPNVFTPNSDGANDVFTIKSTGIKEISLQIFNRWGQKLYEFSGPNAAWDGKSGGEKVPEGTYFYFVKAIGFDDKDIEKNGTVNLFR